MDIDHFPSAKKSKLLTVVVFIMPLLFSAYTEASAEKNKGIESKLSISMGWEMLEYEEHEQSLELKSHAEVNNGVISVEGIKRWEKVFSGIKAVIPVLVGDDKEKWRLSGRTFQTNNFEYRWTRLDSYIGYPFNFWVNPYGGLRWSEAMQERSDFSSKETIRSWSLLLGIQGVGSYTPQWKWNYSIEYFVPLDVKVTNSAFPGFEVTDRDGYTLGVKGGIDYYYSKQWSVGLLLNAGRMHWGGSDWKTYRDGFVKWPENDTDYFRGALNISWKF